MTGWISAKTAFKLVQEVEKTWRRLNGVDRMSELVKGMGVQGWNSGARQSTGTAEGRRLIKKSSTTSYTTLDFSSARSPTQQRRDDKRQLFGHTTFDIGQVAY